MSDRCLDSTSSSYQPSLSEQQRNQQRSIERRASTAASSSDENAAASRRRGGSVVAMARRSNSSSSSRNGSPPNNRIKIIGDGNRVDDVNGGDINGVEFQRRRRGDDHLTDHRNNSTSSRHNAAASLLSANVVALSRGGSFYGSRSAQLDFNSDFHMAGFEHRVRLMKVNGPPSQYVKLNVGGSLHYTTIATLIRHDSMLRAMFSGRLEVLTDSEGWILIDRCGKHIPLILNFLRDSAVALPENRREVMEILAEARYYCIQNLIDLCQAWLEVSQKNEDSLPICKIPIITSSNEEKLLLQSTARPAIKLLLNRHNNKYSYTSQSDDNLLKNLELFDKLITRFHERVLFIKDVGAANEVCSWTYYGHGRKVAEVCCTSIVYATDKKHTKVEFPEARIYEEALNILQYERYPSSNCTTCLSSSSSPVINNDVGTFDHCCLTSSSSYGHTSTMANMGPYQQQQSVGLKQQHQQNSNNGSIINQSLIASTGQQHVNGSEPSTSSSSGYFSDRGSAALVDQRSKVTMRAAEV